MIQNSDAKWTYQCYEEHVFLMAITYLLVYVNIEKIENKVLASCDRSAHLRLL
jgi:hypothetical protein